MLNLTSSTERSPFRCARTAFAAGATLLLLAGLAAPARADYDDYDATEPAGYDTGYSYIRVLDGSATLLQGAGLEGEAGDREPAEVNQPVLAGDRLWVGPRSRVELVLSDRNLLRLDSETEVAFDQLAFSPESGDRVTTLRLLRGNAQLVVTTDSLGDQLPRVDTLNANAYPQDFGVYRVTSDGSGWTEVVVRRGRADVVSGGRTVSVAAGEKALVEGGDGRWADVRDAGGWDGLERWADDLDRRARDYDSPYVDEDLRYAAAPLENYGRWTEVSGSYAWVPRVDTGWRPYWHGRWAYTPAGVTWVSSEPWGWVPYHYGTWDYAPGYGWVWYPGHRFSPAWVYWHWGTSHVAWVPVGYYTRHYRNHYPGFRFGVYGWAGGDIGIFADWVFCDRSYFGRRHHGGQFYRGNDWGRRHGGRAVGRGILTTDTRPLRPSLWDDADGSLRVLRTRPGGDRRTGGNADLPDVTAFVAHRDGELPGDVAKRVAITRGEVERVAGTPLAPGTRAPEVRLARPRAGVRDGGTADVSGRSPRTPVTVTKPGVRTVRPSTGIRGEAPQASGGDSGPAGGEPRSRTGRPIAVERSDAPRAETPRADRPAAGRPGTVIRRSPKSPAAGGSGESDDRDGSTVAPRAVRPGSGVGSGDGAKAPPARPSRGIAVSPRADRPRSATPARPAPPARPGSSARGDDRSTVIRSAPRAERPATVRPPATEPRREDRRGSAPARPAEPRSTVRRSAPPATSSPRAARPVTRRQPSATSKPVRRVPSSGVRAPAPSRAPTARSQPAPSRPPAVRRAPVARSQPAPSRTPSARSAPRRSAPVVRSQPSRPAAPRSTPSTGSSTRSGGNRPSSPSASGGSSSGGGKASRGKGRTRGNARPHN